MTLNQFLGHRVFEIGHKLSGVSYLMQKYKSDGTSDRDREDIMGLGSLLEGLSDEAKQVAELIEMSSWLDGEKVEIDFKTYEHNRLAAAEAIIRKHVDEKRAEKGLKPIVG